jgi:hypothetical protein
MGGYAGRRGAAIRERVASFGQVAELQGILNTALQTLSASVFISLRIGLLR